MEQKYRSKDINDHDDEREHIYEKCAEFEAMEAYADPEKIEDALVSYWANGGQKQTTLATSTRPASSNAVTSVSPPVTSAPSLTITSAPKVTSTKKGDDDDKKKTTTTKK